VNDAPTLALATNNVVVLEDSGAVTVTNFAVTTVGPANESGQSVTNVAVFNVSNATLFAAGPAISTGGTLTFTPTANSNGVAAVTVQARDNGGTANGGSNGSGAQTFTITVTVVNDAPVAITLTGSDVDGPVTNFSVVDNPTQGQLSGVAPNLTYQPFTNYIGTDNFTFTVNDGSLTSAVATVSLTVTAVNAAPVATDMVVETPEDTVTDLMLLGSDAEGAVTLAILTAPTNGVLGVLVVLNTNSGAVTYTPNTNFFGSETFFFTVSDGSLLATGLVSITVTAVNDAPVANDDNYNLGDGVALDIPASGVLTNDSDVEADSLTAILVSGPLQGALNLNPDGGFNYTPTNYFNGVDTFTYQVSDSQTNSGPATVNIVVSNTIQITSIALSNGIVTLTWTSIAGKSYRLQYKESLTDASWTDLLPDVVATGATAIGTNAVDAAIQRFYRVLCFGNQE
jgi:hypothetical protein